MPSLALRRLGAALVAVALALAAAAPVLAEDPPSDLDGVVFDASVTVLFQTGIGIPVVGEVTVTATRGETSLGTWRAISDDAGLAIFSDLPRATDGEPVLLGVAGLSSHLTVFPCGSQSVGVAAGIDGIPSGLDVQVDLGPYAEGIGTSMCDSPSPTIDLPGVLTTGLLHVLVTDASDQPRRDAKVTFASRFVDGEEIWVGQGDADFDGTLGFTNLPVPEAGAPAIAWTLTATAEELVEVDGCSFLRQAVASTEVTPAAGEQGIVLALVDGPSEFVGCNDLPDGSAKLTGALRDADGQPVEASVSLRQERSDGAIWADTIPSGTDGSFSVALQRWGTAATPATLSIVAIGPVTRTERIDGCQYSYGLVGSVSTQAALADDPTTEPIEIVMAEGQLGAVCGETAAPGAGGGAGLTMPPTDLGAAAGPKARGDIAVTVVGLLGIALGALGLAKRRSPRGA